MECYPRSSCQWRNTDYWWNVSLGHHVSEETLTTGMVGCYPQESCQWGNTDYWWNVTPRNHVNEETPTTGRMLPSVIMSVKKHWLLAWSDVTPRNHVNEETPTTGRMLPSGHMSVKKLVWCFSINIFCLLKKDKTQARQTYKFSPINSFVTLGNHARETAYWSYATLGNHVNEETLTTGQMYARQLCQRKNIDY